VPASVAGRGSGVLPAAQTSVAAGSAQGASTRCQFAHLRISQAAPEPATGNHGVIVRFKNTGSRCVLGGYPGVDGLSAAGKTIGSAKRERAGMLGGFDKRGALPTVTLRHGQTASAMIEYDIGPCVPTHTCAKVFSFEVTPPGAMRFKRLNSSPKPGRSTPGPDYYGINAVSINPIVAGGTGVDPLRTTS
jgi:hypothetical protein